MNGKDWLSKFLFCHTPRDTKPDGRPLYAYKCRDKDYEAIIALLRDWLVINPSRYLDKYFEQIFCLYAAEAFRREHAEGIWAWDTVFRPLGIKQPDQAHIGEWVEAGLCWWKRELILDRNKHRRFLVTIACEGGLPLRLLREDTHLRRFFVALLEEYHRQGKAGPDAAEAIAGQQAINFLPPSLCREVVFRLSGELIAKITELQQEVGDAANPIVALDEKTPKWRYKLPLSAEDQTVEELLSGLVRRSGELARSAKSGLRWLGWLKPSNAGFSLEKQLECPDVLTAPKIRALTGLKELPTRLRLILHVPQGSEAVARLTLSGGLGDATLFRREWLQRGGVKLAGIAVTEKHRIVLHDDHDEYEIALQGGEPWGELPWVFVARNDPERLEWLAEGSTRTRADEAWVLAAHDSVPSAFEGASCQILGEIAELGRKVYRVIGGADFISPDQCRYRVECRAEMDSACQYVVRGEKVMEALNEAPVYRGLPRIEATDAGGKRLTEWTAVQQWKPVGIPSEWQPSGFEGSGLIWLRCLDRDTGIERFRRQVAVVPRRFRIERAIGQTTTPGCYQLRGLDGASVRVLSPQQAKLESGEDIDTCRIECPVLSVASLPVLRLDLAWNGRTRVEVQLPYPQRGASFRLGGNVLQTSDWLPLDRLGGLRLLIQDHTGSSHFRLLARLSVAAGQSTEQVVGEFRERLPVLVEGQLDLGLYAWHDRIASLLASCSRLDASVRLDIVSSQQETLASVHVARFDLEMEPEREQACVRIAPDSLLRLEQGREEHISLEMIRLWAPSENSIALAACPDQPDAWSIPTDLEAGPWWVIGRDGGWARFRPLVWTVEAESPGVEESAPSLAQIVRFPQQERDRIFPLVLAELGKDPNHADWPLLFDYFNLTREFPPSALDVLNRLTKHPATLAMALLKADEESFERVWALAELMPFSWGLVPVRTWEYAATQYFHALLTALAGLETGEDIVFGIFQGFRERVTARRAYWRPLCDWLQERVFPDRPAPTGSELRMARLAAACVESQIGHAQQELLGRHDGQERWPTSAQIRSIAADLSFSGIVQFSRLPVDFQPIHFAPFVVAHLCLRGTQPSQRLIYELRLLRHFDPEWFDAAYAMALTLGLAAILPDNTP